VPGGGGAGGDKEWSLAVQHAGHWFRQKRAWSEMEVQKYLSIYTIFF